MRERGDRFGRQRHGDGFRFGDRASRRRGRGFELDTIGPYQWGDDIRHMDWFATARTGRPQVRQFRHEVQQTLLLVIDLRPSMLFGSNRQLMAKTACLAAAMIAWSTSKDHQPLGLLLIENDEQPTLIPPKRGRRARLRCLAQMVEAYRRAVTRLSDPSPTLAEALDRLPASLSADVEAIIISDFSGLGDDFDSCLRGAAAKGVLSAVVVEDGLMRTPPPSGFYPLQDDGRKTLTMVTIGQSDQAHHERLADRQRQHLVARLMGLKMRQVLIADASSIDAGHFR